LLISCLKSCISSLEFDYFIVLIAKFRVFYTLLKKNLLNLLPNS
jgi:hypothetical protein